LGESEKNSGGDPLKSLFRPDGFRSWIKMAGYSDFVGFRGEGVVWRNLWNSDDSMEGQLDSADLLSKIPVIELFSC
jgi:hypothetical protein